MSKVVDTVGGVVSSILGVKNNAANITVASESETESPTEDSAAVAAARRKSIVAQQQRSGRNSTILTSGKLGG